MTDMLTKPSVKKSSKAINVKHKHFPTTMFASAAFFSALMVFVISAVFEQANEPCLSAYAMHSDTLTNNVVVNTSRMARQKSDTSKPLSVCNRNNQQIGWLTWFFKYSDSVEFHYLDLLELLARK
jgi:hypothetical protein